MHAIVSGRTALRRSPRHCRWLLQVLHIRNLPYETTHEELTELASPFGKVLQSKLNVGANRNQAFIELPDENLAIQMVNYFATSSEPAKVPILCDWWRSILCPLDVIQVLQYGQHVLASACTGARQDGVHTVLHAERDHQLDREDRGRRWQLSAGVAGEP